MSDTLLRTPLFDAHLALNARMVPFAGYEMPVQYTSILVESKAVREGAGMFDVSHMARLRFQGERVLEFLEWITSNDVAKLVDGQGQYSLLPNDQGGCVDDIIVYRLSADEFYMVVNASNHEKDVDWIKSHNKFGVDIADETDDTAMIAVQGPKARAIVASLSDKPEAITSVGLFGLVDCKIAGIDCFAPCSGYTGEDGFELICPAKDAVKLWNALLEAGVAACGLGSRDTLRVEAGLPLYGHELTDELSPIAAGLGWVVSKTKSFIGSDIINAARTDGSPTKLQGVQLEVKRLIAPGMKVFVGDEEVGEVSSGVVSPLLDKGIAFAFLRSDIKLNTPCEVDVRGKREPAMVVGKRFFKRS
ncbi:MAG: glycine cleavage system aminomethyltransferase GcvT [Armatimonadetes bacterium]|nr:glycine cleavage system aminomethyltransferase GcvT [Armatimonadota bacterium]